jgi:hypothetical protein
MSKNQIKKKNKLRDQSKKRTRTEKKDTPLGIYSVLLTGTMKHLAFLNTTYYGV